MSTRSRWYWRDSNLACNSTASTGHNANKEHEKQCAATATKTDLGTLATRAIPLPEVATLRLDRWRWCVCLEIGIGWSVGSVGIVGTGIIGWISHSNFLT